MPQAHRFRKTADGQVVISPKWHAEYNLLGKRCHEPLKTTNKAVALREVNALSQRLLLGEERPTRRRVDWKELTEAYLNFVRSKRRAPGTITKYVQVLDRFVDFVKGLGRRWPQQFTPADFWKFSDYLAKDFGCLENTIESQLIIVKQVFKWGSTKAKPRLLAENPIAGEEVPETEDRPQPCFTPEQVAMLLAKADDHHRPIWAVMAYLGLRFGEVRDLRWSDFELQYGRLGWVNIQRGGSSTKTKSKKNRRIPLNDELRAIINALPHHEDGHLFHQQPSKKYPLGGRPLNGDKLRKSIKRLCKRCKFDNPNQYKQHTFRHAFASMLARNNTPYRQALEWMGHEDSEILNLHIKLFDKDAERAIALIRYSEPAVAESGTAK